MRLLFLDTYYYYAPCSRVRGVRERLENLGKHPPQAILRQEISGPGTLMKMIVSRLYGIRLGKILDVRQAVDSEMTVSNSVMSGVLSVLQAVKETLMVH